MVLVEGVTTPEHHLAESELCFTIVLIVSMANITSYHVFGLGDIFPQFHLRVVKNNFYVLRNEEHFVILMSHDWQ
jgi:hypothetical protein